MQVVSTATDAILEEARHILDQLGKDTFIKVPVSAAGLPAIKKLSAGGVNVTATAIYSTMQGMLAVLAGAKYIAVYFNRMENNCTDPTRVIAEIRAFIDGSGSGAKILAASFRTPRGRLRLRERRAGRHRGRRHHPPGAGHDQHRRRGGRLPEGF
ncbi:MAG: transaldolase family protein [Anaerotruncus massiliensis (ex Togo et al. 2019)]